MTNDMEFAVPIFVLLLFAMALLFGLQFFEPTGIYLMFLGAGVINGALLLLSLLALFVEALIGRVPRWLAIIPIAVVVGYYGVMAYQWVRLPGIPAELGLVNASSGLIFDPQHHAIDQKGIDPNYLLARYQVPRIYDSSFSKVRTVAATRSCEMLSYRGDKKNTPGAPIGIRVIAIKQTFCFSYADALPPTDGLITFDQRYTKPIVAGIQTHVQALVARLDGSEIGRVSTVKAEILSLFPIVFLGCWLNDSTSSWDCGFNPGKDWVEVWPNFGQSPRTIASDQQGEADQIAKLLSLTPRSEEEISAIARLPDTSKPS